MHTAATHRVLARSTAAAALVVCIGSLGACNKQARTDEAFIGEYRAGDYSQAYRDAEAKAQSSDGEAKDRASLMAGLAAYAERKPDVAERWLTPLAGNANAEIAGTAEWTLGLIALDRGNNVRAASLLPSAAGKLKGDDAAKANVAAGDASARLGRASEARERYQAAVDGATIESTRAEARQRLALAASGKTQTWTPNTPVVGSNLSPTTKTAAAPVAVSPAFTGNGFVVQLAAVSDAGKAAGLAASATPAATNAGQPKPVVTTTVDRKTGRTLYGVQIGPYSTRQAAESGLKATGLTGTVMAISR